jgi:hypothetical protein
MVDTKALLKGFGAASDVAGQIATDKAVNARRLRPKSYAHFDITAGQLLTFTFPSGTTGTERVLHGLGKTPSLVLRAEPINSITIDNYSQESLTLSGNAGQSITLWVV